MSEKLKKYYPLSGKKSPYVIHPDDPASSWNRINSKLKTSTMADKEYIRYTSTDWDRNRVDSFTNSKILRLLLIICALMATAVFVRQCIWPDRSVGPGNGGVEHIQIILVGGGGDMDKHGHDSQQNPPSKDTSQNSGHGKMQCKPGETNMKDCNTCSCIEDGSGFACTKMFCGKSAMKLELGNGIDQ